MARAVWSGSISFGLVNVGVKAYSTTRDHAVHFHQLQKKTGARISYEKVSAKTQKAVPSDQIERGFEIAKGHYVVVTDDELDALRPKSTRTIDITDFVDLGALDPIYYEHTYWLGADGEANGRAYRLLEAAMEDAQRVAIGTVVMRDKQYLAAIRPFDGALVLNTMRFADEIRSRKGIDGVPSAKVKAAPKELKLASQLIDSLAADWDPKQYHDTYTEELRSLIERKSKGEDVTAEEESEEESDGKVVDLMAALEASLKAGKRGRPASAGKRGSGGSGASGASAKPAAKKGSARKPAAKKAAKSPARAAKKSA